MASPFITRPREQHPNRIDYQLRYEGTHINIQLTMLAELFLLGGANMGIIIDNANFFEKK